MPNLMNGEGGFFGVLNTVDWRPSVMLRSLSWQEKVLAKI